MTADAEYAEFSVAEPVFGSYVPPRKWRVHPRETCAGPNCCIHNPSDHPLRSAPLHFRMDRGIMERLCEHGVGHPDPDDAEFRRTLPRKFDEGSHGCDGCCAGVTFDET